MPDQLPDWPTAGGVRSATDDWTTHLGDAIDGRGIRTVYQPIVDLHRRTIVGYEALTRFDAPLDGERQGPDVWFQAAHRLGLGPELEAAALRCALRARPDLPPNCFLAVNVDPESLLDDSVLAAFRSLGALGGLVIEITEHRPWDWDILAPVVGRLRTAGARFAVDDTGVGYSGLQQILRLRPDIVKIDRALVEGIDHDEAKRATVEMLGVLANHLDAWILAEGAENLAEARALLDLRVPLVQGYYFARPEPPWAQLPAEVVLGLGAFVEHDSTTLHRLVHPAPAISEADHGRRWLSDRTGWLVVVDTGRRPLGLLDDKSTPTGTLVTTLTVNVHSSPEELARRLATSELPATNPVLVTDNAGCYLGIVTTRRLLRALSG